MGNTTELVQNRVRIITLDGIDIHSYGLEKFEKFDFEEYPGLTIEQAALACVQARFPNNMTPFDDGATLEVEVERDRGAIYCIPIVWTKCWKAFDLRGGS